MRKKLPLFKKIVKRAVIGILLLIVLPFMLLYALTLSWQIIRPPAKQITYGVTFSQTNAKFLQLDWQKVYIETLDDLNVKHLRLQTYWNTIQKDEDKYDFSENDYMLDEAAKRGVKVILTVGIKQPRWPECYVPDWAQQLSVEKRQEKALEFITEVVKRYKDNPVVESWQVENEPLIYFYASHCDKIDLAFLQKEVALIRSIDSHPIVIADSGELSLWKNQMQLSDVFGTTLYRTVWNKYMGYTTLIWPPGAYSLRSDFFRSVFAPNNKKTIVVELQSEPWLPDNDPINTPIERQIEIFSLKSMDDNIEFANKTSFDEIYLWGVEWWYFMKQKGHPEYWDNAKKLFP